MWEPNDFFSRFPLLALGPVRMCVPESTLIHMLFSTVIVADESNNSIACWDTRTTEKLKTLMSGNINMRVAQHHHFTFSANRTVFNRVLKVIRECFGFASLRSVIGCQNSRHFHSRREAKPKPISAGCTRQFSRAWRRLHVVVSCCDWFIALFMICCDWSE